MVSIVRALSGEYIEPQAGGDLLRDGAGVLPTGMQHALQLVTLGHSTHFQTQEYYFEFLRFLHWQ